ncbi:hypothetical protein ACROYT_G012524 [Oculina patagonica]
MSELKKKLKKKEKVRESHRVFVRKTIHEAKDQIDKPEEPNALKKLKSLRCTLQDKLSELKTLDNEIVDLVDDSKIEETVSESCDFQSAIQACIVDLETAIDAKTNEGKSQEGQGAILDSQSSNNSSLQTSGTHSSGSTNIATHAKLPKLELKKFSGNPIYWHPFWESFESAIDKNTSLNDVDKFQYLKSLLEGPAAQTISGLTLTSSNYSHAVELLNKRFGSKQVIISKHIELLMQLSRVNDGNDLKQLRQLLDRTEAAVRSLQGIGVPTETYGTFLTPVIMGKIPQELRLILSREASDEWDLDTIMKSFTEELRIRERCALGPVTEQERSKEKHGFGLGFRPGQNRRPPTSSTLFSSNEGPPLNKDTWCTFCNGPHPSTRCAVVTDPEARKKILRRKGKCFGCLRSGHLSRDCQARCYRCGGKHHLALCNVQEYPGQPSPAGQARGNNQEQTFALECQDNLTVFVNAYEVDLICGPIANQTIEVAQQCYPHLQGLPLADYSQGDEELEVDILIGADYYWSVVQNHVVVEEDFVSKNDSLKNELSKFWDYDTLGVKEEEEFLGDYLTKVKFNGVRYEVSLPFKEEHPVIPDNYLLAQNCIASSLKRLKAKPDILQQYDTVIKEQLSSGVVEMIDKRHEEQCLPGTVHYIPHKEVVKEDRTTTKLRVVYDASAKSRTETSLNDCLLPGPALTPLIFDILVRFRLHKVALIGDLEKAFLNIEIIPEERDLLRFLWIDDINSSNPEVITLRFTRLVFGLVCSPFILNVTLRNHLSKYENIDPSFVDTVVRALYVDDFASGKDTVKDSFELYRKLKLRFGEGGFNMRKWASNSQELTELIKKEEAAISATPKPFSEVTLASKSNVVEDGSSNNTVNEETLIKVMGVPWDRIEDNLKFDLTAFSGQALEGTLTKRKLLSTTAQFYDPLGLLSPVILPLKCMFQEICGLKIDWDETLSEDLTSRWKELFEDMERVSSIAVPRCILDEVEVGDIKSIQLHGFADASKYAFGANVYIKVTTSNVCSSHLLASKTRVGPLNGETISRLELMAALTLANLMTVVYEALVHIVKVDAVFNWTDSQIVWWWINGESKQFKQFVQNRVQKIRSLWKKEHWRYCPSELNPADIASRGAKSSIIASSELWWKGAPFLKEEEFDWPSLPNCPASGTAVPEEALSELKKESSSEISRVMTVSVQSSQSISEVIQPERFSSLSKLLRVTALVLKFLQRLRKKTETHDISMEDMNAAKHLWYKEVQTKLEEREKSSSTWEQLAVFKDEQGVLRCKGRIQNSSLPYSAKFPILLPRKQHFTKLVIMQAHGNVKHNGVRETLTEIRAQFWIIKGRQAVKDVLSKCVTCKKILGRAYSTPPAPPLPSFRVSDDLAFSKVGVDFAGPLYVKNIYESKGEMFKCYIALFTCASTRAIHVELVPDLTASSFLRVLKRFFFRRGLPNLFISDNGKTFKDGKVKKFVLNLNIDWKFNVPTASWWGGFFEICVKLVKRCLKKVLGNAKLSYEELETVLIETEGVLNSRPLTYVYDELSEGPLTPSHLVIGRRLLDQSPVVTAPMNTLARRERYLNNLLDHFRNRWKEEYLTGIREYQKLKGGEPRRAIQVGDIVHIYADKKPRQQWRLGKVEKLLRGRDNVARAAEVVTVDNSLNKTLLKRPIQKLYPLEVNELDEVTANAEAVQPNSGWNIQMVRDEDIPTVTVA